MVTCVVASNQNKQVTIKVVVCPINFDGLRDPRLLKEVGDLTTPKERELMTLDPF
jgi:hypothetical protein